MSTGDDVSTSITGPSPERLQEFLAPEFRVATGGVEVAMMSSSGACAVAHQCHVPGAAAANLDDGAGK